MLAHKLDVKTSSELTRMSPGHISSMSSNVDVVAILYLLSNDLLAVGRRVRLQSQGFSLVWGGVWLQLLGGGGRARCHTQLTQVTRLG